MRQVATCSIALLALLTVPLAAEAGGPSQVFKEHGFSWTLPTDDWQFQPVNPGSGFVAKAECLVASVEAYAFVKDTAGLSLDEFVGELKSAGGDGLGVATKTKVMNTTLSGVPGKVVIQAISAEGGAKGHFRKYAIVADGKFCHLLIRTWHDAHMSSPEEVNGIRKGFRLLSGAGKQDQDEALDELGDTDESGGSGGMSNGGGAPEGGDDEPRGWPPGGPPLEGNTVKMHEHNLEWSIEDPWRWAGAIDDAKAEEGQFVLARATVKRDKKEYEKDTPDNQEARFDLLIFKGRPGFKSEEWVRDGTGQSQVENWKYFDEILTGKTRNQEVVKLGNHKGAYLKLEGTDRRTGQHAVMMMFVTQLQGELYIFRAFCWGHTDVYKQMAPYVGKALKGVRFLDTKEPQAGPLLCIVPDFSGKRGADKGQEKTYTGPGYTFEKPPEMARVQPRREEVSMNRDFRMAFEGRSKDGEAYFYFEIRTYRLNIRNTPNPDEEKFIETRGRDWLAGAGEGAGLGTRSGALKIKKASFNTARGLSYEFTGSLNGAPFVEQGWVVKHKSVLLWLKAQFGGKGAEKKLKDLWKDVRRGLDFKK